MSFTNIPVLDLNLAQDPATKDEFLRDLCDALVEVGFMYLKNTGIPDHLFHQTVEQGKAFFDIPQDEKSVAVPAKDASLLTQAHKAKD